MKTTRIFIGLTALLCTLAATTNPADAFFEATTPGATEGPAASLPTKSVFEEEGAKVVCTQTANTKGTGFWTIQNSEETITELGEGVSEQKQPATKVGPHEAVTIKTWGTCVLVTKEGTFTATVGECRLQAAQPAKDTKAEQEAFGSVQKNCVIKATPAVGVNCTITIPQTKANHNLKKVKLTNTGSGVEYKSNITGITASSAGAGCVGIPAKTTKATFKTGELEGNEAITSAGQKLI